MQKLGNISADELAVNQTKEFYDTYIEIGELLTGNVKEDLLQSLEVKFNGTRFFLKLLIAWCLAKTYLSLDDKDKSDKYIAYCIDSAPYCKPLHIFK